MVTTPLFIVNNCCYFSTAILYTLIKHCKCSVENKVLSARFVQSTNPGSAQNLTTMGCEQLTCRVLTACSLATRLSLSSCMSPHSSHRLSLSSGIWWRSCCCSSIFLDWLACSQYTSKIGTLSTQHYGRNRCCCCIPIFWD